MTDINKPEPMPVATDAPALWDLVVADVRAMAARAAAADDGYPSLDKSITERWRRAYAALVVDMRARDWFGRTKYGVPLQIGNGRNFLVDLIQELLDAIVYCRGELENIRAHLTSPEAEECELILTNICAGLIHYAAQVRMMIPIDTAVSP
jgi:hypothetical protein